MSAFVASIEVPAPVDAAFRFVVDGYADNHPRWDPAVVRVQTAGLGTPGATGCEVRRFLGRDATTRFVVLSVQRPSTLVLRDIPAVWALTRTYRFEPAPSGGTRLSLEFDMSPRAPWFRLLHPLLAPVIRRSVQANVTRLGRLLTAEA